MEAYGSYSEMLAAPRAHVARTRLALAARGEAEQELAKERKPGTAAGGKSRGTTTTAGGAVGQKKRPVIPQEAYGGDGQ